MANASNRPATFGLKTKSGRGGAGGDEAAERRHYAFVQAGLHALGADLRPRAAREVDSAAWPGHVRPGDHVAINCGPAAGGLRDAVWHHAIWLGDGQLVHMHPNGDVCEVDVDSYLAAIKAAGDAVMAVRVIQYDNDSSAERAETVRRAREMLARQAHAPIQYHVVLSNCECFATYCRTGRWESEQVNQLLLTVGRVLHAGYQWWAGRSPPAARGAGGDGARGGGAGGRGAGGGRGGGWAGRGGSEDVVAALGSVVNRVFAAWTRT